jgi:ATP-dependent DNA helicase DinG
MPDDLGRIFSATGPFDALLPRWQPRGGQLRMARAVTECLARGGASLVEAGTGTGKTLAYLVPAVLSGLRVIVSTGTHTLQDQLLHKDIPLVREALGVSFDAAVLKGRANYLCLRRFALEGAETRHRRASDARRHATIRAWAGRTHTGDRAEVPGLPDDFPPWRLLSATSEQCLGQACGDFDALRVPARRARWRRIVVVNHHLFADLALRARGFGEVFPPADAVILDEAHQIEQVAPLFLGRTVSSGRFQDLLSDARREGARVYRRKGPPESLDAALDAAKGGIGAFFERFRGREGRMRLRPGTIPPEALDAVNAPSCGSRRPSRPGHSSIRTTLSGPVRSARGTSRTISSR